MNKSTLGKIVLTAVVAVGGVGFLVKSSVGSAQHYKMVDDLLASDMTSWTGKELKVHGWVESGSIHESIVNQETHRTFLLQKGGKKIRVFSEGPKPDTFKDQSEVVATGHLVPAAERAKLAESLGVAIESDMPYVVDSSELMAKCPSKYDGARVNQQPDQNTPQFK
ncbi:MAG TPA: cytochrome c maturation protein CcmE [Kofleriaceae bacterium]|nr:cytochrome c maturation protein CcmE [Kofleriaceae bacterium]